MSAFQGVLQHLKLQVIPLKEISLNEGYCGQIITFEKARWRTKNIASNMAIDKCVWKQKFTGELDKDAHIYCKMDRFKIVVWIDQNWITTSTAFCLLSSGQVLFSGMMRITNVDYEKGIMYATGLVVGIPNYYEEPDMIAPEVLREEFDIFATLDQLAAAENQRGLKKRWLRHLQEVV
jgi:hypothetical protein